MTTHVADCSVTNCSFAVTDAAFVEVLQPASAPTTWHRRQRPRGDRTMLLRCRQGSGQ